MLRCTSLSVIFDIGAAQLLDVRALLADDETRTRRVDRNRHFLCGRSITILEMRISLLDRSRRFSFSVILADLQIFVQQLGVIGIVGKPARVPRRLMPRRKPWG
jgi:hypothetical protein